MVPGKQTDWSWTGSALVHTASLMLFLLLLIVIHPNLYQNPISSSLYRNPIKHESPRRPRHRPFNSPPSPGPATHPPSLPELPLPPPPPPPRCHHQRRIRPLHAPLGAWGLAESEGAKRLDGASSAVRCLSVVTTRPFRVEDKGVKKLSSQSTKLYTSTTRPSQLQFSKSGRSSDAPCCFLRRSRHSRKSCLFGHRSRVYRFILCSSSRSTPPR